MSSGSSVPVRKDKRGALQSVVSMGRMVVVVSLRVLAAGWCRVSRKAPNDGSLLVAAAFARASA